MINKSVTLILFFLIVISINASASDFSPGWYWPHQKVDIAHEYITVSKDKLDVEFKGIMQIDNQIYNESDWITFTFSPVFNYRFDEVENFRYHLGLRTSGWGGGDAFTINKKADYTLIKTKNYSRYQYNVSVKNLKGWNSVIFYANFTLKNKIRRIREAEYSFFYISQIETQNQYMFFYFPNKFEIISYPENGKWKYGTTHQVFLISGENAKNSMYFVFRDKDEIKSIEERVRSTERLWNYIFALMSAILGFSLALIYEHFKKNKRLEGETSIKHYKNHDVVTIKVRKKR